MKKLMGTIAVLALMLGISVMAQNAATTNECPLTKKGCPTACPALAAKTIAGSTGISLAPYTLAALVYFCINYPASKGIEAIERRMRRGDKQ